MWGEKIVRVLQWLSCLDLDLAILILVLVLLIQYHFGLGLVARVLRDHKTNFNHCGKVRLGKPRITWPEQMIFTKTHDLTELIWKIIRTPCNIFPYNCSQKQFYLITKLYVLLKKKLMKTFKFKQFWWNDAKE